MAYNRGERPDISYEKKKADAEEKKVCVSAVKKTMRSITRM